MCCHKDPQQNSNFQHASSEKDILVVVPIIKIPIIINVVFVIMRDNGEVIEEEANIYYSSIGGY